MPKHCDTCRCHRSEAPLPPEESLVDRNARVRLMDRFHLGTQSIPRFDEDPTILPVGWHAPQLVGAGDRGAASARLLTLVAAACLLVGLFASGLSDQQIPLWVAIIGYATSTLIGLAIGLPPRRPGITPIIPEVVAETRKMYATAAITATVLKNGENVGQRKINQRFSGETHVYSVPEHYSIVPLQKTPDLVELVITTHVVTWHDITHPMPGSPELPFRGGTREETP